MQRATRVFVISDLDLGGEAPAMMSFPGELARFVDGLPGRTRPDEAIELVIAGDVIDFLAIEQDGQTYAWTGEPARAVAKLQKAVGGADAMVYAALARTVARGLGLTVLVGNHLGREAHGLKPQDVLDELARREGRSGLEEFARRKAEQREKEGL